MKIEILYFQGCPNHVPAVDRVRAALADEGVTAEILQIEVNDTATAGYLGFLGSPTVRIDGTDIEGSETAPGPVGLSCRTYMYDGVREGVPPAEVIRRAVRIAKRTFDEAR